jgi:hypothetical protein
MGPLQKATFLSPGFWPTMDLLVAGKILQSRKLEFEMGEG